MASLFPVSKISGTDSTSFVNYAVVDAFTDVPFKGNPAGVCILPAWRETEWLQQAASELNLNMTAFLVKRDAEPKCNGPTNGFLAHQCSASQLEQGNAFSIRWFTPFSEVDLCGHATLASAYLLFESGIVSEKSIEFYPQKGGVLYARREQASSQDEFLVELDFPILPTTKCDFEEATLSNTLHDLTPLSFYRTIANDLLVELPSEEDVRALKPSFDEIKRGDFRGLIVTGRASVRSECDFVSRFFAPKVGIDEDPVCGQAHCALTAFWAKKLNKSSLIAYQASKRGGILYVKVDFEAGRVYLQGQATLVMSGALFC